MTFRAAMLAAAMLALPASATAQDYIQLGIGADYSTGDYGETEDTDFLAVPVSAKYKRGNFDLRVSIPYVHVEGPADVIPGDGGVRGGADTPITSRSGLGDINVAATYSLPLSDRTYFDVTGKVKLPTASEEKALGTGTTDFTAQAELFQVFGDLSASLRGGRRFNGSSAAYPLEDVWLAGAGAYYLIGGTTLGLDYDWREGSLPTSPDRSEITASLTQQMGGGLRLQGYAYTGLANGSPDIGAGAQILYRWGL